MPLLRIRYISFCFRLTVTHLHLLQALDFLSSHSPTVVILLKNDTDNVPLSLLEEIHLIITLCANVLPSVPKSEMVRFKSFHFLNNRSYIIYNRRFSCPRTLALGLSTPLLSALQRGVSAGESALDMSSPRLMRRCNGRTLLPLVRNGFT